MSDPKDDLIEPLRTDYRRPPGSLTGEVFARMVIEGSGGMNDYEAHELVHWHSHERVAAAEWMLRCLANSDCEGSKEAVAAILRKRREAAR